MTNLLEYYKTAMDRIDEGVYFVDMDRRILFWNKSAELLTGFSAQDVVGKNCRDQILMHVDEDGNSLCKGSCPLIRCQKSEDGCQDTVFLRHKNGHRQPVNIKTEVVIDEGGDPIGAIEVFSIKSRESELRDEILDLQQQALLDPLTRLVNRRHLEKSIITRLEEMQRYNWAFGMLFIDVDGFKQVNDLYGHETGDKMLRMVSMTLSGSMRPFDMVGRWGGDEFLALLVNVDAEQLVHIANRARVLVSASSLTVEGERVPVTVSIGATMARKGDSMEIVVKRADALMYESKAAGRNTVSAD